MQTSYPVNVDKALAGQLHGRALTKPRTLPYLPQIEAFTMANSEAGTLTISVQDDETGLSYDLEVTISGAVEATSLDEILAAWQANGKFNDLFSVTEDGATVLTATARHANRSYTFTVTEPGSMTFTPATSQEPGGSGIGFGLWVQRGSDDQTVEALDATTAVSELEGVTVRTEGNHFHELDEDFSTADLLDRGRTLRVLENGSRVWVEVEEAVTPASTPYVRRAQTSGAGTVGGMLASPAGGQQVYTLTPTATEDSFGFTFSYLGTTYTVLADAADGTYTATEICDDLRANAPTVSGITFGGTATLTITTAAGTELDADPIDVGEGAIAVAETTAADVDALDVSDLCRFETSASAGELALLYIK